MFLLHGVNSNMMTKELFNFPNSRANLWISESTFEAGQHIDISNLNNGLYHICYLNEKGYTGISNFIVSR